jgi:5'-phosphate synthase pdxT subunit
MKKIGILALQGDVTEHFIATKKATKNLGLDAEVFLVREKKDILNLDALIIPGGESTTLQKLCERAGIFEEIKKIRNIFGTCAGAIMLAQYVENKTDSQKTLELMDITISRNAYGQQTESFAKDIDTTLGKIQAIFIRAPKIKNVSANVKILAKDKEEIVACEQQKNDQYFLAACFHPELTTTIFHEYFLRRI